MAIQSIKGANIEETMLTILNKIQSSQNFKRYCCYLNNDPLAQTILVEGVPQPQPDITDDLIDNGNDGTIYLTPFDINIATTSKVRIFFNPIDGQYDDTKGILVDDIYLMDIIVPLNCWVLRGQGKIRVVRIFTEIAKAIDNQFIDGVGKTRIIRRRQLPVDSTHASMQITIKLSEFARKTVNN